MAVSLALAPSPFAHPPLTSSRLGAAALLVQFDLVLEAVVQFEVVVLQGGGGA